MHRRLSEVLRSSKHELKHVVLGGDASVLAVDLECPCRDLALKQLCLLSCSHRNLRESSLRFAHGHGCGRTWHDLFGNALQTLLKQVAQHLLGQWFAKSLDHTF